MEAGDCCRGFLKKHVGKKRLGISYQLLTDTGTPWKFNSSPPNIGRAPFQEAGFRIVFQASIFEGLKYQTSGVYRVKGYEQKTEQL